MPKYLIEDPKDGRKFIYEADSEPDSDTVNQILDYGQSGSTAKGMGYDLAGGIVSIGGAYHQLSEEALRLMAERGKPRTELRYPSSAEGWLAFPGQVASYLAEGHRQAKDERRQLAGIYRDLAEETGGMRLPRQIIAAGPNIAATTIAGLAGTATGGPVAGYQAMTGMSGLLAYGDEMGAAEEAYRLKIKASSPWLSDEEVLQQARSLARGAAIPAAGIEMATTALMPGGFEKALLGGAAKEALKGGGKFGLARAFGAGVVKETAEEELAYGGQQAVRFATYAPENNPLASLSDDDADKLINPDTGILNRDMAKMAERSRRWGNFITGAIDTAGVAAFYGGTLSSVRRYQQNGVDAEIAKLKGDKDAAAAAIAKANETEDAAAEAFFNETKSAVAYSALFPAQNAGEAPVRMQFRREDLSQLEQTFGRHLPQSIMPVFGLPAPAHLQFINQPETQVAIAALSDPEVGVVEKSRARDFINEGIKGLPESEQIKLHEIIKNNTIAAEKAIAEAKDKAKKDFAAGEKVKESHILLQLQQKKADNTRLAMAMATVREGAQADRKVEDALAAEKARVDASNAKTVVPTRRADLTPTPPLPSSPMHRVSPEPKEPAPPLLPLIQPEPEPVLTVAERMEKEMARHRALYPPAAYPFIPVAPEVTVPAPVATTPAATAPVTTTPASTAPVTTAPVTTTPAATAPVSTPVDVSESETQEQIQKARALRAVPSRGALLFYRGVRDFKQWSERMVAEFGEGVKTRLDKIYKDIQDPNYVEGLGVTVTTASKAQQAEVRKLVATPPKGGDSPHLTAVKRYLMATTQTTTPSRQVAAASQSPARADSMFGKAIQSLKKSLLWHKGLGRRMGLETIKAKGFFSADKRLAESLGIELNEVMRAEEKADVDAVFRRERTSETLRPELRGIVARITSYLDERAFNLADVIEPLWGKEAAGEIRANIGHLHRSYEMFDNPNWINEIESKPEVRAAMLRIASKMAADKKISVSDAIVKIKTNLNELLGKGKTIGNLTPVVSFGEVDGVPSAVNVEGASLSTLIKRKHLDSDYRTLLGEHKDPILNFRRTILNASQIIAHIRMQKNILQIAIELGLISKASDSNPNHLVNLDSGDSKSPFKGYKSSVGFSTILEEFNKTTSDQGLSRSVYATLTRLAKVNQTAGSLAYSAQQMVSAVMGTWINGGVWHLPETLKLAYADSGGKLPELGREVILEAHRNGVLKNNILTSETRNLVSSLEGGETDWLDKFLNKGSRTFEQLLHKISVFDNAAKMAAYLSLKKKYRAAYPEKSSKQIEDEVSLRVIETFPSRDTLPPALLEVIHKTGFGNFASFTYSTILNLEKSVEYAYKDLQTPQLRDQGLRTLAGVAAALMAPEILQLLLGAAFNDDTTDEDEKAFRASLKPWEKYGDYLHLGKDESGKLRTVNLSFINPYTMVRASIRSLFSGDQKGFSDTMSTAAKQVLAPVLSRDMFLSALEDSYRGKDSYGNVVWLESDGFKEKTLKGLFHMIKGVAAPATLRRYQLHMAATIRGEQKETVIKKTVPDLIARELLSVAPGTFEPKVALRNLLLDYNREESQIEREHFSKKVKGDASMSEQEARDAYKEMNGKRIELYEKTLRDYNSITQSGLLTERERLSAIMGAIGKGVPRATAHSFRAGKYYPMRITPEFRKDVSKQNLQRDRKTIIPSGLTTQ